MFSYIYVYDTYHVSEKNVIFIHSYYRYYSYFTVSHCKCNNSSWEYIYCMYDIFSKSLLHLWCFHIYIYIYMIYIIPLHNIVYSFYVVISSFWFTVLQSFTVSVPTPHTSIYTICIIYFLNHHSICDVFIYIYIWYISYHLKHFNTYSN